MRADLAYTANRKACPLHSPDELDTSAYLETRIMLVLRGKKFRPKIRLGHQRGFYSDLQLFGVLNGIHAHLSFE
jgi:hypothetical protein